ncbi:hypothetical protein BC938DRAFT_477938 [Jimgerdemannia flammicorona]|uniref:mRNA capping enzyme C-terminal domain-containing protein n=1 Tax=Jimgerdemannia flammicorona TaxID=994334 RepID=A0A433QNM5_9FUNG|nr:hypothetical protein BC938DRAFT_477938 [Jimgerdemannia flammicorona]
MEKFKRYLIHTHTHHSFPSTNRLKWKPADQNTVDFRINVRYSNERKPSYALMVAQGQTNKHFDHLQLEQEIAAEWKKSPPDNKIAEFRYDPEWMVTIAEPGYALETRKGGWRFVRFRDDKDTPNDEAVVKKIMKSIEDAVSKEQLLAHMEKIRTAWKAREKVALTGRGSVSGPSGIMGPYHPAAGSPTTTHPPHSVLTPSLNTPTASTPSSLNAVAAAGYFSQQHYGHRHRKTSSEDVVLPMSSPTMRSAELPGRTAAHPLEEEAAGRRDEMGGGQESAVEPPPPPQQVQTPEYAGPSNIASAAATVEVAEVKTPVEERPEKEAKTPETKPRTPETKLKTPEVKPVVREERVKKETPKEGEMNVREERVRVSGEALVVKKVKVKEEAREEEAWAVEASAVDAERRKEKEKEEKPSKVKQSKASDLEARSVEAVTPPEHKKSVVVEQTKTEMVAVAVPVPVTPFVPTTNAPVPLVSPPLAIPASPLQLPAQELASQVPAKAAPVLTPTPTPTPPALASTEQVARTETKRRSDASTELDGTQPPVPQQTNDPSNPPSFPLMAPARRRDPDLSMDVDDSSAITFATQQHSPAPQTQTQSPSSPSSRRKDEPVDDPTSDTQISSQLGASGRGRSRSKSDAKRRERKRRVEYPIAPAPSWTIMPQPELEMEDPAVSMSREAVEARARVVVLQAEGGKPSLVTKEAREARDKVVSAEDHTAAASQGQGKGTGAASTTVTATAAAAIAVVAVAQVVIYGAGRVGEGEGGSRGERHDVYEEREDEDGVRPCGRWIAGEEGVYVCCAWREVGREEWKEGWCRTED